MIIHRADTFGLVVCEWNCMLEIQKTWVRFKHCFGQLIKSCKRRPSSPLKTPVCIMPTWCAMLPQVCRKPCIKSKSRRTLRRSCKRMYIMWPTRVKKSQQQLATQIQQMQAMMQAMHMQYAAATQSAHQDYGGRQEYGGNVYHGHQSNYHG